MEEGGDGVNYLTVTEFRERDYKGQFPASRVDDTTVGAAISIASRQIDWYRGHTFEDSTAATETFDGPYTEMLDLRRPGGLPLRSLTLAVVDDTTVDLTTVVCLPYTGPPYTHLRRKAYGGDPLPSHWVQPLTDWGHSVAGVTVTGDWGWAEIPEKVKEATFRLAARYLLEEGFDILADAALDSVTPKKLKLQSGAEYTLSGGIAGGENPKEVTTGDDYVDNLLSDIPPLDWGQAALLR